MLVEAFFDKTTFTLSYVVYDEKSLDAVVIDPVQGFNPNSGKVSSLQFDRLNDFISSNNLKIHYSLETHVHADHLSGAPLIKAAYPSVKTAISENIKVVQDTFTHFFNITNIKTDGSQFDVLLGDGDILKAGDLEIQVIATPGHTPSCVSFLIEDALFTGDALFMPDMGTGRCDFPKGDALSLFNSIKKLYQLADSTRVFVGHDYGPKGRKIAWETTIKIQKESNVQLTMDTTEEQYVSFRDGRDANLAAPKLLWASIQINMNGGNFPPEESNGKSYLKIPLS